MLDLLKKIKDSFTTKVPDTSPTGKVDKVDVAKLVLLLGTKRGEKDAPNTE